jgi:hypothetical protein
LLHGVGFGRNSRIDIALEGIFRQIGLKCARWVERIVDGSSTSVLDHVFDSTDATHDTSVPALETIMADPPGWYL